MATPPAIQMIFGKPKINIETIIESIKDTDYLSCSIFNKPVTNKFLQTIGVYRNDITDLTAAFEISQSTGDTICSLTPVKIRQQQGVLMERVTLPASVFPVHLAIAGLESHKVRIFKESKQILPAGDYTVTVSLFIGSNVLKSQFNFYVRDTDPYMFWA